MEDYKKLKANATNSLDSYLTSLLTNGDEKSLKKIKLMSYWMKEYCGYLHNENNFKPEKLKRYERGDIIKVNLGYNVGCEEGGLHYAVVWDMKNSMYSDVVTVIPLSSVKKEGYSPRKQEVLLGDDLYKKLCDKCDKVFAKCKSMLENDIKKHDAIIHEVLGLKIESEEIQFKLKTVSNKNKIMKLIYALYQVAEKTKVQDKEVDELEKTMALNEKDYELLRKTKKEIGRMKKGGIALVGQITTISKMRIYDPKNSYNVLSGIKLSPNCLDEINKKFKELYLYE